MQAASAETARRPAAASSRPIAIRCEPGGYGVRFGLTEAEDQALRGPVFETLPEALAFVDAIDGERGA